MKPIEFKEDEPYTQVATYLGYRFRIRRKMANTVCTVSWVHPNGMGLMNETIYDAAGGKFSTAQNKAAAWLTEKLKAQGITE